MSKDYWFSTHDPGLGAETKKWDVPVWLHLYRYVGQAGHTSSAPRKPVLLLHGASANSATFLVGTPGLACCLYAHGFDPWLLDWRGSSLVVDEAKNARSIRRKWNIYNFNLAAAEDLPAAIQKMRQTGVEEKISLLGHCMGGGVAAEAVALGHITNADVDRVVLIALGLFYAAPIDSRLKSEERILERLSQARGRNRIARIDARVAPGCKARRKWPEELTQLYDAWPGALRSHAEEPNATAAMCNRLSFMYGMPYHHKNLAEVIHDNQDPELLKQFGAIPLRMYLHAARNLRRGHATFFKDQARWAPDAFVSDAARERFREIGKVTLITGALNRLWHRDSIDRMYEWLCSGLSTSLPQYRKRVFQDYGHQDLLWGRTADAEVYPEIVAGLQK